MKAKNALVITFVLVTFLFQACTETNPEKPEEEKPVSLVNKLKSYRYVMEPKTGMDYYYNSEGLIERIDLIIDNKVDLVQKFNYKDGLLSTMNSNTVVNSPGQPVHSHTHTFKHNGNQIVEISVHRTSNIPVDTTPMVYTFSYDLKGFGKTRKLEYIRNGKKDLYYIERLTTDDKGNVTELERDFYRGGEFWNTVLELREYDNKVNPLYKVGTPILLEGYLCPNNLTKLTYVGTAPGTTHSDFYTYEYNAAGLPLKITTKTKSVTYVTNREYYK
jgi:hypothetical protein